MCVQELSKICKNQLSCFSVAKKYISKKNNVFLLKAEKPDTMASFFVYKEYFRPERMRREIQMLSLLKEKGVFVPVIYGTGENYILLEYLEGTLLLDYYCWLESRQGSAGSALQWSADQFIYNLCYWFKSFYIATREIFGEQLIMGDVNFRNFIIRDKIYGIDLEECREGRMEEDLGSLCAFGLTYAPTFTAWKLAMLGNLVGIFCQELDLNREVVKAEIQKQLLVLARIRGKLNETEEFLGKNMHLNLL